MIITVATTPELFRTSTLSEPVSWSEVNELADISVVSAGGGTNVATALYCAGADTKVLVPAPEVSQFIRVLALQGLPYDIVDVPGPVPVRYLIDAPDGRQLQFVDPPMDLKPAELAMLRDLAIAQAEHAQWIVLAGTLPNVANAGWYVDVMRALRLYHPGVRVAVCTSGSAFGAVLRQVFTTKPDVIVVDATEFPSEQDCELAVSTLIDAGVPHILVCHQRTSFQLHSEGTTLSASFRDESGKQWLPWVDSALAGLLLVDPETDPQEALISALAWANAEIGDKVRSVPTPDVVRRDLVELT